MSGPQPERPLPSIELPDGRRFVDCNCGPGQKCPQGKTGNRVRCFIPIDNATIGDASVPRLLQVAGPPRGEGGPTCKGAWSLGSACGKCSRCLETALPFIMEQRAEIDAIKAANTATNELIEALTGCIPVFETASPAFKAACIDEQRRLLEIAGR